ncbi:uncharacterized protein PAC_12782 [Phialocephala subalpina]|uniref:Uncharacterized protein n=1 Tax=Phialocephala subalpina TaxID=576137 RepID=A0A1L7XCY5_9HELO|nr:uncharacterized protein PAC_12782 [Phialocephala subalpina]
MWTLAHIFFAILMFSTLLVKDHIDGTVLIAFSDVSWVMTLQQEIAMAELEPSDENQAGLITSLHNTAISIPQIVAALACSAILWVFKIVGSQDGVACCLRAGGLAALAAAWTSSGFGDD